LLCHIRLLIRKSGAVARPVNRVDARRAAVDLQLENVRPVVVAGEVVPQLGEHAQLELAIRIENALLGAHGPGDDAAVRRHDDAAAAAIGIAAEIFRLGPTFSIPIICSSTVPQAETTNALLICAKACASTETRLRIGSPLVGKWFASS